MKDQHQLPAHNAAKPMQLPLFSCRRNDRHYGSSAFGVTLTAITAAVVKPAIPSAVRISGECLRTAFHAQVIILVKVVVFILNTPSQ